jgi:hypothetical protein
VSVKSQIQRSVVDGDELVALRLEQEEDQVIGLIDALPTDVCTRCSESGLLLVCDSCDKNFHQTCIEIPLVSIPEGLWICDGCEQERSRSGTNKSDFVQLQRKRKLETVSTFDDEDDGPIDLLKKYSDERRKRLYILKQEHKSSQRKIKNKRMRGYKDDGFVVPANSDEE